MDDTLATQSAEQPAPPSPDRTMLGIALRLLSVFLIAIMLTGVKYAQARGVSILESLFWRQLAGLPVVLAWLSLTGSLSDVRTKNPLGHLARMVVGLSAMCLNYLSVSLLPLAEATTIGFAVPIFSTLLAAWLLKEATGRWRWSAIVAGFIGIVIVIQPGSAIASWGTLVAVVAAMMTASITIIIRQLGKTESTGAIVFWFSLTSLLPLGIAMPFVSAAHPAEAWVAIGALALAGAAAQICLTSSLRFAPVATVLPMDYSMLVWSVAFGWLFFDQLPAGSTWIGAPIVIGAGLVIVWREHRARRAIAAA